NLIEKGVEKDHIYFVGNTMIDTLVANMSRLQKPTLFDALSLKQGEYIAMTLHRPSNVDEEEKLAGLIQLIGAKCADKPVIFPVHPRTKQNLEKMSNLPKNIHLTDPMGYLEFMFLIKNAFAVVTDSGGIQEETTFLGIPCLTLREN